MKKVIIAGGTGFVGNYLTERFLENGYSVLIVSRAPEFVNWSETALKDALEGSELLINLAGKSINCRHTSSNKKKIRDSRIETTTLLSTAVSACKNPPKLWINMSATGIYTSSPDKQMTETDNETGKDFLAKVVNAWEQTFFQPDNTHTRKIALRTSVVLGKNGGALSPLVLLSKLGLGGKSGNGKQKFSWLHIEDLFRIIMFCVNNGELNGVLNCTSPNPVTNSDLMKSIRIQLHKSLGIPAPALVVKIVSGIIGIPSNLILSSSNVIPLKLQSAGFNFEYADIPSALKNLLE